MDSHGRRSGGAAAAYRPDARFWEFFSHIGLLVNVGDMRQLRTKTWPRYYYDGCGSMAAVQRTPLVRWRYRDGKSKRGALHGRWLSDNPGITS